MKRKPLKAQRIPTEKRMKISSGFLALAKELKRIREQQSQLGLFCHDRELLSCPKCEIEEDVTFDGFLIVAHCASPGIDTGLKFSAVDEEQGLYRCPVCGRAVLVPESEL